MYYFLLYGFAGAGILFVSVFFAIKYHVTDVGGKVDENTQAFEEQFQNGIMEDVHDNDVQNPISDETPEELALRIEQLSKKHEQKMINLCRIDALETIAPKNAAYIFTAYQKGYNDIIVDKMLFACELRLDDNTRDRLRQCRDAHKDTYSSEEMEKVLYLAEGVNIFPWMNDEEWQTIKEAIVKDRVSIERAAQVAHVEPRLIVANAIVEQVRLFHSQRALYKQFFAPLKILGNATKISLGIMGIKEATAIDVENHLVDPSSPYYLGQQFEHVLDFTSDDVASERFKRLTNEKDHYYSYLYGALYLKQMMHQWQEAGYDIQYRPEIIGTLFNVGFPQSHPNPQPKVGGSAITVGKATYSFGSLAYEFYYSGELLEEFPFVE